MSDYDVLAHGDALPAVPLPAAEPAEPAVAADKPADAEPDFDALIERERERLADAEAELDRVLTVTCWDGMGGSVKRAEEAASIVKRRIKSLELRQQQAADSAAARAQASQRAEVSAVAQRVADEIDELAERTRAFLEGIDAVKGSLADIAAACERIRKLRKSVKLRTRNRDVATFEAGGDINPYQPVAALAGPIANNLRDVARIIDGAALALGLPLVQPVDKIAPPPPRDFSAALHRLRKEFVVDVDIALGCTGRWGGKAPADWGTDL